MKPIRKLTVLLLAIMGSSGISQAAVILRQPDASLASILAADQRPVGTDLNGADPQDSASAEVMAKKKKAKKPKKKKSKAS